MEVVLCPAIKNLKDQTSAFFASRELSPEPRALLGTLVGR